MRINKLLAAKGFGARRKIDELIDSGKVEVNGIKAQKGQQIVNGDKIRVNDEVFVFDEASLAAKFYIVMNKPEAVVCTFDKLEPANIDNYLRANDDKFLGKQERLAELLEQQFFYSGRLDKNSSGLLLFTNDGDLNQRLTHPAFPCEKEYLVTCNMTIDQNFIDSLKQGVMIPKEDDNDTELVKTRPCHAEQVSDFSFRIILRQGYKRQIRKMVRALGPRVDELERLRIANLALPKYKNFIKLSKKSDDLHIIYLEGLEKGYFKEITNLDNLVKL